MSQFRDETKIIPFGARFMAGLVALGIPLVGICYAIFNTTMGNGFRFGGFFPIPMIFATIAALFFAIYILVLGYIYGDAKRRGMRPVLWLLLGIFIPNMIGVILYFILRQPIQLPCPACGVANPPGFAFCSSCGQALTTSCPSCKKTVETNWTHCPHCGISLNPHSSVSQ